MSITFTGGPGAFFNRIGKIGLLAKQLRSYQSAQFTNMTDTVNGVIGQYNGESDLQAIIGSNYVGILTASDGAIGGVLQSLTRSTVNRQVFRDNPQINQTLTNQNTLASLQEIIRQMKVQGVTVLAMPVTATPTGFTGNGAGAVVVASVRRPLDGLVLENSYSENLLLTCSSDSYSGGSTSGNEPIIITGVGGEGDVFAFDWPLGSNSQTSVSAIDGSVSVGSGNLLTNSGFENWTTTANVPDNWTLNLGTAGTNVFQETANVYDGGGALRVLGDNTTNFDLRQQFASSSGTTGRLSSITQYSVCLFLRRDAVAIGAGQLSVELIDQNGVVTKDVANNNNAFTIDLTTPTTSYVGYSGVFRTSEVLPTTGYLRLRLTTGISTGRNVYIDRVGMGLMTQVYTSGPYLAVHSGASPFTVGDYANCQITNGRGSGGTLDSFQVLLARLLPDVINNEILFPSSNTPSVSDTLIG